jgi:O-antigen ligase
MARRAVWEPPAYAWLLAGVAGLAVADRLYPAAFEGAKALAAPLLAAAGILVLRRLWQLPPTVTMCAAIVLTIFSGAWSYMGLGGIPIDRLLVVLLFLQILLRAPGMAHVPRIQIRNVHLLMALTLVYALGSAAIAGTLGSEQGLLLLVDVFGIAPFLLFLLAPSVFSDQRARDLLLITLVGLGAYLGVTAIFESVGPSSLVFPRYIHAADIAARGGLKIGGPFQSSVPEGFANFACAVAAVMAMNRWRSLEARCFAGFVALACVLGCFLTLERGVWIAAVAGAGAAALTTRQGRRWLLPAAGVAAVAVAVLLVASPQLSERTSGRASYEQSVWDRKNQNAAGLRMLATRPLLGFGFDRYETESVDYFRQPQTYPMTGYVHDIVIGVPDPILPLHNTYLSYAVELGLIGALLWLGFVLTALGEGVLRRGPPALRPWKIGLLAISVFFLIVSLFDPHTAPFPVMLLLIWAGVAVGSEPLARPAPARLPRRQIPTETAAA